jgi:hypothetical protein
MTARKQKSGIVREIRTIACAEQNRQAELLLEWEESAGQRRLRSVSCDHPRLAGLDPWDCHWSCWEKIAGESDRNSPD